MLPFAVAKRTVPLLLLVLSACSGPQQQVRPDKPVDTPSLAENAILMEDGYRLPLRYWLPPGKPHAVLLALHGFNDYSNAFASTASYLRQHAIAMYAVDQRGFGESAHTGLWAGEARMQADLLTATRLLCHRYPDTPVYVMGESMGGAVILQSAPALQASCAAGVILSAPAVWGWETMPWWQAMLLRMMAHVAPAMTVTGEGLDIRPSDNTDMLRTLGRDPLVIKKTRIDAIYGLTDLMQSAHTRSIELRLPTLLLYGEQDEIITPAPMCDMLENLGDLSSTGWRMLLYPDGFHMLTRDLQAARVHGDIAAWLGDRTTGLPSGLEVGEDMPRLQALCK
ncbi:MAG TPA: lysophospholipase [Gammaproteobacteria bacterium]|jgi:alpha-beta hydrolase superfamily lysophospholipase|nr:lysophospholipase [Gammaproteobacteria bacterium]